MNTRTSLIAIALPASLLLVACQSLYEEKSALQIVPTEQVRHSVPRPEALYALGRYYQGQMRHERAIDAYQRLLAEYPAHAEAHNALGLIYAAQGRHDEAVAEFMAAVKHAPTSASLHNNLGYAYLLQERFGEAQAALEIAARLDPANRLAHDNLDIARRRLADNLPASPPPHATAPVVDDAVRAPRLQLVAQEANVFTLESAPRPKETPALAAEPAMSPKTRVEVANGNGVTGLATQTSTHLARIGYAAIRRTNDLPYRMATTEIQYRPGYEAQANALQTTLRGGIPLVASNTLRADVQVRLLLGKDVRSVAELASN